MKTNIKALVFSGLCISLMSCHSYQYVQLKSDLEIDQATNRYFVEDENVRVAFDFRGYNFPVKTFIYNNSDKPIFIDKVSTVYIQNGQKVADALGNNAIVLSGSTISSDDGTIGFTNMRGSVANSADMIYIPSGNFVAMTRHPFYAAYDPAKKHMANRQQHYNKGGYTTQARTFDVSNPMEYEVSIMYSTKRDLTELNELRGSFVESHVYSSGIAPSGFGLGANPSTYFTHKNHSNTVAGIILGGLLIWAIVVVSNADAEEGM